MPQIICPSKFEKAKSKKIASCLKYSKCGEKAMNDFNERAILLPYGFDARTPARKGPWCMHSDFHQKVPQRPKFVGIKKSLKKHGSGTT